MISETSHLNQETTFQTARWVVQAGAVALGVGLNTTFLLSGINMSVADIGLVLMLASYALSGHLRFHIPSFLLLTLVATASLFVGGLLLPTVTTLDPNETTSLTEFLKLSVLWLYLALGYATDQSTFSMIYRSYALAALAIATVGIVIGIFALQESFAWMFDSFRYRGLMSDPNYYAVTASAAVPFFILTTRHVVNRILGPLLLLTGVVMSGSKTGVVAFAVGAILVLAVQLHRSPRRTIKQLLQILAVATAVRYAALLVSETSIPSFENQFSRISILLDDPSAALSTGGSGRDVAWTTALSLWDDFFLSGIGLGTYGQLAKRSAGVETIAHNTFLQWFVEWGTPLTTLFLVAMLVLSFRTAQTASRLNSSHGYTLLSIEAVFLVASLSISLNNARLFWLTLGAMTLLVSQARQSRPGPDSADHSTHPLRETL